MFDWRSLTDKQIVEFIVSDHERLKEIRKPLEAPMDLVTKLFLPRTWDMQKSRKPGTEGYGVSIYNHVPSESRRKFAAGFVSHTVTKGDDANRSWINFIAQYRKQMESDRVKTFMQENAEQVRSGFDSSTFYRETAFQPQVGDASCLWGVMTIDEDLKKDRLVFRRRDPRDHWFGIDEYGDIDVDHFEERITAKNLVKMFGETILPDDVVKQAKGQGGANPHTPHKVIQAIYENGSVTSGGKHNTDLPFIQFYVLLTQEEGKDKPLLKKQGLNWRPSVLRIGERLDSGYPLSMAMDALTAATQGNTIGRHALMGSHAMMEPPRLIHESLRDQIRRHKLNPASNTYYATPEEKIEYLNQNIDPRYAEELLGRHDNAVEDRFFIPFFEQSARLQEQGGSWPTATQINKADAERIGQLSSVVESSQDDSLEPSVDAVWQHETDAGRMPDPPQELVDAAQGRKIRVLNRFGGELAQLRRSLRQNQGMIEAMAIIREMGAIYPMSIVIVKSKRLLEQMLVDRIGQNNIYNEREVAEIEAQLAEVQQEERQMEQAERMSKIIPSVTKDAVDPESPAALALAG